MGLIMYRKATVVRTNPAHVAKYGASAFDDLFTAGLTSDEQIIAYYTDKMADEGYRSDEFSISLNTVTIAPNGKILFASFD